MALDANQIFNLKTQVPSMGIAFALALISGKLAKKINVPKVTAYILIGILIGPGGFNLLNKQTVYGLDFINDIAFGLILFNIGGIFNRKLFSVIDKKLVKHSLLLSLLTLSLTSLLCFSLFSLTGIDYVTNLVISLYLGVIAMDTAPPTTLFVLKEYESSGPLSNSILVYLPITTLVLIFMSNVFEITYSSLGIWPGEKEAALVQVGKLLWSIFGTIFVGVILGFLLSYWEQKEKRHIDVLFSVACMILLSQALCHYWGLNPLLISLTLGFTVVNTSTVGEEIHDGIKNLGLGIYILFFVLAGAHIDLKQQLLNVGIFGVIYIVARSIAIISATKISSKLFSLKEQVYKFQGFSLLSHAGLALAIAHQLKDIDHPAAKQIFSIVISSIFFFEILGPISLKICLDKSQESGGNDNTNQDMSKKTKTSFRDLLRNFIHNVQLTNVPRRKNINSIDVLIKKDVLTLSSHAPLSAVSKFVGEQESEIYPVIDKNDIYLGSISLESLRTALSEKDSSFILASQLIDDKQCLHRKMSLEEAALIFEQSEHKILPVIDPHSQKMIGVISYKDIVFHIKETKEKLKSK